MYKFLIIILCILSFLKGRSQDTINIDTDNNYSGCNALLYDSGLNTFNYSNNENHLIILSPSNSNKIIQLQFNKFDIDPSDTLIIFDGDNIFQTTIIGKYNNKNSLLNQTITPSQNNTSNSLTLLFKSDKNITGNGWEAIMSCKSKCTSFSASIDSSSLPIISNKEIHLCKNEPFSVKVKGNYSNTNEYNPSDETSQFIWNMGDNTIYQQATITHQYLSDRAFHILIQIIDINGCYSQPLALTAKVSSPHINITPPDYWCSNSEKKLTFGSSTNNNIQGISTKYSSKSISFSNKDTNFIAKENTCSISAHQELNINSLNTTEIIKQKEDLRAIYLSIEHEWISDLNIELSCPNGQSIFLKKYPNQIGKQHIFGYPNLNNNDSKPCDPLENPIGKAATYAWSAYYDTIGKLTQYEFDPSNTEKLIPPTDTLNKKGYFSAENEKGFQALIGCPLNGKWDLNITDKNGENNGYLFEWSLEFAPHLNPQAIIYQPLITEYNLFSDAKKILNKRDSTFIIESKTIGNEYFKATVIDEFGCKNDTDFFIPIIQTPEFSLGKDTVLFNNKDLLIQPDIVYSTTNYNWNTQETTPSIYTNKEGLYILYAIKIENNQSCSYQDSINIKLIEFPESFSPVVITPNNDGYNDKLHIPFLEYLPNTSILIFNRWGNIVYSDNNYQNNWYPNYLSTGTYYFIIQFPQNTIEPQQIKGSFSILK